MTTKDKQIWVRVSDELKGWLQEQAKRDGRSLSNFIANHFEQHMKDEAGI